MLMPRIDIIAILSLVDILFMQLVTKTNEMAAAFESDFEKSKKFTAFSAHLVYFQCHCSTFSNLRPFQEIPLNSRSFQNCANPVNANLSRKFLFNFIFLHALFDLKRRGMCVRLSTGTITKMADREVKVDILFHTTDIAQLRAT